MEKRTGPLQVMFAQVSRVVFGSFEGDGALGNTVIPPLVSLGGRWHKGPEPGETWLSNLVMETQPEDGRHQKLLAELGKSCGGVVETATLLRQFDLEEFIAKLPAQLPVHCQSLTLQSLGIAPSGAAGAHRGSGRP